MTLARGAPANSSETRTRSSHAGALTTTAVVDNLLDYTANVSIALRLPAVSPSRSFEPHCCGCCADSRTYEVERAELGGRLVQAGVGREDGAAALTLVADDTTHGD